MRGSKAAAEVAALEGLLSSPNTQECKRIYLESIGCDYDSLLMIDECTSINKPQLSRSTISQPLSNSDPLVPGIEIFSCSQQAVLFAKARAALDPQTPAAPHVTDASGRDPGRAQSDFLDPRGHSHTEQTDVHPARHTALHKSSEKIILPRALGIAAVAGSRAGKMENFILPLDGSDGSNLSPTQENDPAVYIRLQQELLALAADSQGSSQARICTTQERATNNGFAPCAQDTGITYTVNDTGHLTLDYQPLPSLPLHDSFDEDEVGEVSSGRLRPHLFNGGLLQPQTPAQARLVIGNPGTVMRPSQMFAETQPSPGSRDRHLLPPSSSRPSPDVFNQYQSPKHLTSSPLVRRVGNIQSEVAADFDVSSSPECSQPEQDDDLKFSKRQPLSEPADVLTNARGESPFTRNLMHQNFPGPFDIYTTRQESQERRRQQARVFDDADQSSDDDFSDDEAKLNRRAKRRKEEAARELAIIGTSRPGSAGKDFVEVPSTRTGRRRSLAEEYEAQCSGLDARDTQPDATIVDSQSAPDAITASSVGVTTRTMKDDEVSQSDLQTFQHQHHSEEDPALSGEAAEGDSSEQLPALEQNEDSQATESDQEGSRSPVRQSLMSEVLSNIAELHTPAMHKKLPYIDGDTIVPETSPSEPHLQRYGGIVSQTPPVLSAEEVDDFNLFTQDFEFNNLIQSPSPRRTRSLRTAQPVVLSSDTHGELGLGAVQKSRGTETLDTDANHSTTGQHENGAATSLAPKDTASEDTSEYITAPTGLPFESLSTPKPQSNLRTDSPSTSIQVPNGKDLPEGVSQGSQIKRTDTILVGGEVSMSEGKQQSFPVEMVEGSPSDNASLPQESANKPKADENNVVLGATEAILEMAHPESHPVKKTKTSSKPSKIPAKQSKASSDKIVDVAPVKLAAEPSEVLPNRLRSATQLRGSSRALRRLLEDSGAAPSTPAPMHVTPTATVQKVTHSSRRSSTNSSEKAQSTEPEANTTPTLSTRRRALSNQPTEPGLFDGMAFSVTYSASRENEKQQVLGLIRKNGGRVLEKGFDELFDMNTLHTSSVARTNDSGGLSSASDLTLTSAARRVGFACVIADEHSRRVKFMQALALGLPCISGRWIEHCVARKEILDWDQYHLAAGESSFLGGAIRSRNMQLYPANTANFANLFESRPKLLTGKSILLITGKGRAEERRKPYFFLTQALGARRVKHVPNNQEARKFLLEAESNGEEWNWVYVDENEDEAEKAIFGAATAPPRKRKRGSEVTDDGENTVPTPKKVRIVSDEYVIQSLILGKFLEE